MAKLCKDCQEKGAKVRAAFSPSEVAFLVVSSAEMMLKVAQSTAAMANEARTVAGATMKKLLICMSEPMLEAHLKILKEKGLDVVIADCEENKDPWSSEVEGFATPKPDTGAH